LRSQSTVGLGVPPKERAKFYGEIVDHRSYALSELIGRSLTTGVVWVVEPMQASAAGLWLLEHAIGRVSWLMVRDHVPIHMGLDANALSLGKALRDGSVDDLSDREILGVGVFLMQMSSGDPDGVGNL
jgi:hypothetical protein